MRIVCKIIRRFSENAEAGDHYTPREVIRALSSILLAEGCDDVFSEGKEITVLDQEIHINKDDYFSLTDIAKYKNPEDPRFVIQNWIITNSRPNST